MGDLEDPLDVELRARSGNGTDAAT